MDIYEVASLVSMMLTPATLVLAMAVVIAWRHGAVDALQEIRSGSAAPTDYFLLGVFIAFVGQIGDNLWWGIAWTDVLIEGASAGVGNWWFRHGTFSNIFFRQLATIVAAILHLRAASTSREDGIRLAYVTSALTLVYLVFVYVARTL